jgi:hypothetical protein
MSNTAILKTTILASLDDLPASSLETLAEFTSFLRAKSHRQTKPRVVKLRGLWSKAPTITEEDIAEARREMWGNFGDREV